MSITKKAQPAGNGPGSTSRQAKATSAMGAMMARKVDKTVQMKEKSSKRAGHK